MCAKFDQNERIEPIASGRSKSSANVARRRLPAVRAGRFVAHHDRRRQKRHQMRGHADRAGARAAAAVRDRERLVQVEVHEVEAHVARAAHCP